MKNPFKRPRARKSPRVQPRVRGYQLALPGAGNALNWSADRSPDADVRRALSPKRGQSRAEVQNGDYLAGYLLAAQRNVVGSGLRLRSLHPDADVAKRVVDEWRDWSKDAAPNGDSRWRVELLALSSLLVDGEIVAHLRMEGPWGLRVHLLDAATLDHTLNRRTPTGAIRLGVEFEDERPVAYWLRAGSSAGSYSGGSVRVRVPAREIVYVGNRLLVAQTRGMPFATPALTRLEQLRHYETAELISARLGNKKMGYVETEAGGESPYSLDQPHEQDKDEGGSSPVEDSRRWWAESSNAVGSGVDYGVDVTFLDPGQRFQGLDWPHPTPAFGDFVAGQLRGAAAALGTNYHGLSGDLSRVNFSAGRIGEIASRQTWLHLRQMLTDGFHTPLFRRWVEAASLRGRLPGLPSDLGEVEWVGRGFEHIQPREQARANEIDVSLGLKSRSEIIRESGREPEHVFREIKAERAQLLEMGVIGRGRRAKSPMRGGDDKRDHRGQ